MWFHQIVHVLLLAAAGTASASSLTKTGTRRENVVRGGNQHQGGRRMQTWEQEEGVADYLRKHGKAKYTKKYPTQAPTVLSDSQADLVPISIPRPTTTDNQQPPTDVVTQPTIVNNEQPVAPTTSPGKNQSAPADPSPSSPQIPSNGSIVPVVVPGSGEGKPSTPTTEDNSDDESENVPEDGLPGSTPTTSPGSDTTDQEEGNSFTVDAVPPASSGNQGEEDSDLNPKVESPESLPSEGTQENTLDGDDSTIPDGGSPTDSGPANGDPEGATSPEKPKDEKESPTDDASEEAGDSENSDSSSNGDGVSGSDSEPEQEWATESDVNTSVDGDSMADQDTEKQTIPPTALLQSACDAIENGDDFVTNDSRRISYSYELLSYKEDITLSDIVSKLEASFETFLANSLVPCGEEVDFFTDSAQIRGFSAGVPDKFVGGTCNGLDFYAEDIYFCYVMAGSMDVYLMDDATVLTTDLESIVKKTLHEEINEHQRKLRSSSVRRLNSLLNFEEGIVDLYMRSDDASANQVTTGDIEARSPNSRNGVSGGVSFALVSISLILLAIVGFATARKYRNHGADQKQSRIQGVVTIDHNSWMGLEKESTASITYHDKAARGQKYALPATLRNTGHRDPPVGKSDRVLPETTITGSDSTFGDWVDVDCQSIDWSQNGLSMVLTTDKMREKGWSPSASSPSSSFADGAPAIVSLAGSHTRDYDLQNSSPSSETMLSRQSKISLFDFDTPSQMRSKSKMGTSISPIDHELLMLNGVVKTPSSGSTSLFSSGSTPTQSPPSTTGKRAIWSTTPEAANEKGTDQGSPSTLFDHVNTVASHASSIFEGISKVFVHPENSPSSTASRTVSMVTGEAVSNRQSRGRSRTPTSGSTNSSSSRSSTRKSSDYKDLEVRQQKVTVSARKRLVQAARKQSTKTPQLSSVPGYSKTPSKSTSEREYPSQPDTVEL